MAVERNGQRKNLKYVYTGMLLTIFIVFGVTRFLFLDRLPLGLHVDEAGTAYDAWCLSQYGVDRYLKSWPVYFINFGGGQNALYTWICAGLFKVFGYSIWALRFPAVLFSFFTLVFGMKLAEKLYPGHKYIPLWVGGLAAICPCFILMSRTGLESYLMLGMATIFLYCFVCALDSGRYVWYALSGVSGGLMLYTYAISYLVLLLFLFVMALYILWVRRFSFRKWLAMGVILSLLAFPLILVQLVNLFNLPEMKLGPLTITKLPQYRIGDIHKWTLKGFGEALKSIFAGDWLIYNSIPGYCNLYSISIILFAIGFICMACRTVRCTMKREWDKSWPVLAWFLSMLFFLSKVEANVNRVNGIFCAALLIIAEGILALRYMKWESVKKALAICIAAVYLFCFGRFAIYYYGGGYLEDHAPLDLFEMTLEDVFGFLESNPQYAGNGMCIRMLRPEIYYAVSFLESPYTFGYGKGENEFFRYGDFEEIEEGISYLISDCFERDKLRLKEAGYEELTYEGYSLFYKDWTKQ